MEVTKCRRLDSARSVEGAAEWKVFNAELMRLHYQALGHGHCECKHFQLPGFPDVTFTLLSSRSVDDSIHRQLHNTYLQTYVFCTLNIIFTIYMIFALTKFKRVSFWKSSLEVALGSCCILVGCLAPPWRST